MSKDGRVEGGRGLEVATRQDGTWLQFNASDGGACAIHIENLAKDRGPVTKEVLLRWCADQAKLAVAAPVPAGEREPAKCGKNLGNDILVIPCDLPEGHEGECERRVWPVSVNEQLAAPPLAESQPNAGIANFSCDPPPEGVKVAGFEAESQGSETPREKCPSCQATDNNPYTDQNGVAMRACGRCMIQWRAARVSEGSGEPEQDWHKLPVGTWFFHDSPTSVERYSVQERTSGGCSIVCSTPYVHAGAKRDMQEIARLHNAANSAGGRDAEINPHEIHNRFCGEDGKPCQACQLKNERAAASSPRAEGGEKK